MEMQSAALAASKGPAPVDEQNPLIDLLWGNVDLFELFHEPDADDADDPTLRKQAPARETTPAWQGSRSRG